MGDVHKFIGPVHMIVHTRHAAAEGNAGFQIVDVGAAADGQRLYTSSADTDSSQIINSGFVTIARAMAIR